MDQSQDVDNVCKQGRGEKKFNYVPCALCPGDGGVGKQHEGEGRKQEAGVGGWPGSRAGRPSDVAEGRG